MQPIAIVDYGAGNLRSVQKAFHHLGYSAEIVTDPTALADAPAVVFPGQGTAPQAMRALKANGMDAAIRAAIEDGTPFFGVCLGLQLLMDWSEEADTECLGIIPGTVRRFPSVSPIGLKVPQMGWNSVEFHGTHLVFEGVSEASYFYFVHGYYAAPKDDTGVIGTTDYGVRFASAVARDNIVATQFHPEKSGPTGLRLYDNFMRYMVGEARQAAGQP